MSYYRIHPRMMTEADLHREHVSHLWSGNEREEDARHGVSCCASYERLVRYFRGDFGYTSAGRGADLGGSWLVEFDGDVSDDSDFDGEELIHPTRILHQEPVSERFLDDVCQAIAEAWDGDGCRYDEEAGFVVTRQCDECDAGRAEFDDGTHDTCPTCGGSGRVDV